MKRRWFLLLILLMISALVLSACGGTETEQGAEPTVAIEEEPAVPTEVMEEPTEVMEEPTEAAAEEPTEAATEPAAEEPTEAATEAAAEEPTEAATEAAVSEDTLVIWADETRSAALQALGDEFEAEYGIPIVVEQYGFGDIRDNLKIAGPAGEGPDIIIGAHDWLGELVINGLLSPIDLGEKEDLFLPAAIQAFVYNGELYGMPYAVENVAFVYNPELVETPPTTWSEVTELATELEEAGTVEQGYIIQQNDPYHFFPIMTAFGGYVFELTEEGYNPEDVGIDSEGTLAAAEWLGMMVDEGHILPGVDYDVMHEKFETGQAAMMITGPWALERIRESGVPYAVTTIPGETQPAQPFLGVQGFMISAFSDKQLLAETFLTEFVATDETMMALFEVGNRASAYLPVVEQIEDEDLAAFAEAGENGLAMPAIPEMSAVWTAWGNAQELVITGAEEPVPAFENAAEQIRTTIAESE